MTATDFQQPRRRRRRGRRRRYLRRALRVLAPVLLLLATVLLSLGIVHVIERDVLTFDEQSDPKSPFSEDAQRRRWERRYDDLLREHYGEDAASARYSGKMEQGDALSGVLSLEKAPGEEAQWMPELAPFQLKPLTPDSEEDFDHLVTAPQFLGDPPPPRDLR